jgi:hypothetical protein
LCLSLLAILGSGVRRSRIKGSLREEFPHASREFTRGLALSIGGTIGIIVGVSTSVALSSVKGWPTVLSVLSILLAFSFSEFIGIFFGFYPAYKASLLGPIDELRYD